MWLVLAAMRRPITILVAVLAVALAVDSGACAACRSTSSRNSERPPI